MVTRLGLQGPARTTKTLKDQANPMRRRRRGLLILDVVVLLTLGGIGLIGLICRPEYYVVDLAVPIALIVLYVTLR
jgi:hypothetical protein